MRLSSRILRHCKPLLFVRSVSATRSSKRFTMRIKYIPKRAGRMLCPQERCGTELGGGVTRFTVDRLTLCAGSCASASRVRSYPSDWWHHRLVLRRLALAYAWFHLTSFLVASVCVEGVAIQSGCTWAIPWTGGESKRSEPNQRLRHLKEIETIRSGIAPR